MKKFIVLLNNGTAAEQNKLTAFFQAHKMEVWHWFENVWLISNLADHMTPQKLCELPDTPGITGLSTLMKQNRWYVVFELTDPVPYFGMGPQAGWDWMLKNWGKPWSGRHDD